MMKTLLFIVVAIVGASAYGELRDPTKPPSFKINSVAKQAAISVPRLRSIVAGPERRLALINNTYLAEGERHAGIEVIRVGLDNVVVSYSGKQRTLTLNAKRVTKEFK